MRIKIQTLISQLLVFYILIITDTLIFATHINKQLEKFSEWSIVVITFLLIFRYVLDKKKSIRELLPFGIVIVSLIVSMIYNNDFTGGYILKILIVVFGFIYTSYYSYEYFVDVYLRIMKWIMISSLALYILRLASVDLSFLPILYNTKGMAFYSIYIANIHVNISGLLRNIGPFWEPGVYSAYLCIAYYFSLYSNRKINKWDIILTIISIVLTFSTAGIIVLLVISISYLFSREKFSNKKVKWLIVFSVIIIAIVILENGLIYDKLFYKFVRGTDTATFSSRWNSIWGNLIMIYNHPLLGGGPNKIASEMLLYLSTVEQTGKFHNLNTVLANFSIYGFAMGSYYLMAIAKFVKSTANTKISQAIAFVALILLLSSEGYTYSLFFNVIFFLQIRLLRPKDKLNSCRLKN